MTWCGMLCNRFTGKETAKCFSETEREIYLKLGWLVGIVWLISIFTGEKIDATVMFVR